MATPKKQFKNIDDFIEDFPPDVQKILKTLRKVIHEAAPGAEEAMRYGIPTFRLNNKNLVHFSAYAKHIGLYPTSSAIIAFKKQLSAYKWNKGSVQFPLDKLIPYELVRRIVKFKVMENLEMVNKEK